jgi:hypothetical protein
VALGRVSGVMFLLRSPAMSSMRIRVALVAATVVVMLVLSIALPALANPLVIVTVAAMVLGLSLVDDRRTATGLALAATAAVLVTAWVVAQPSYI